MFGRVKQWFSDVYTSFTEPGSKPTHTNAPSRWGFFFCFFFFFCFVLLCFVLVFRLLCAEVVLLSGSERVCLHTSMPFPQKITHMHTTTCLFFTLDRPNNVIVPVLQTERYCHDLLLRKASHSLFHSLTTTLLLL